MSLSGFLWCVGVNSVTAHCHDRVMRCRRRFVPACQYGFTLIELVITMLVVGILGTVVAPKFFDNSLFQSRGFADQVKASLRYGQKVAIAQNRFVCAAFSVNSVSLTTGLTAACGSALQPPGGGASYLINAPAGITFSTQPADFNFDAIGRPSTATVAVIGITTITVEAETGYVH